MRSPTTGRLLGALRYGPSSASGPDPASAFLEMSPAELRAMDCYTLLNGAEVIQSAKAQFTQAQRDALIALAADCTDTKDPFVVIPAFGRAVDEAGGVVPAVVDTVLGADGLLGGVAEVIGNTVLALAGVALVVLGVARIFGVTPARAAGVAVGAAVPG